MGKGTFLSETFIDFRYIFGKKQQKTKKFMVFIDIFQDSAI